MATPSPGKRRMDTDVLRLIQSRHKVKILSGINEFIVKFEGPVDTPYFGGLWNIRVELPERYPYKSPSIGFMNRIFHPNIDEPSGSVCLDVINQTWTPLYDLKNIFDVFLPQLLSYPNPSDPLNGEAATMYLHNKDQYIKRVKESVQRYATPEILSKQALLAGESSSDEDEDDQEVRANNNRNNRNNNNTNNNNISSNNNNNNNSQSSAGNSRSPLNENGQSGTTATNGHVSQGPSSSNPNQHSAGPIAISSTSSLRKSPEQDSNDSALPATSFQSSSSHRQPAQLETITDEQDLMSNDGQDSDEDFEIESQEDVECSDLSDGELEMDF